MSIMSTRWPADEAGPPAVAELLAGRSLVGWDAVFEDLFVGRGRRARERRARLRGRLPDIPSRVQGEE